MEIEHRSNRGIFSEPLKKQQLEIGNYIFTRNKNILPVLWKNKCYIFLLSTVHGSNNEKEKSRKKGLDDIDNPKMILEYNKSVGGMDKCDQFLIYYAISRNLYRWLKIMFVRKFFRKLSCREYVEELNLC